MPGKPGKNLAMEKNNMQQALIKLSYKQILSAADTGVFAQQVINASYEEFLLKSQVYNREGKLQTFTEMKTADVRANSLHYKSGFAVGGFIEKLNKQIPGIKTTQEQNILFETHRFEVLESNIHNKAMHSVAIHYVTGTMTLVEKFGDTLLLAYGDKTETKKEPIEDCFLLALQPGLSIASYQLIN